MRALAALILVCSSERSFAAYAEANQPECQGLNELRAGALCRVKIRGLLPLQSRVGMLNVREKEKRIEREKAKGEAKLQSYLQKKRPLVIVGPGKAIYLLEHHHLVRALANLGYESVVVEVAEDLSWRSWAQFRARLEKKEWGCPLNGNIPPMGTLPTSISALADDPYRSLADRVHDEDGFKDSEVPFSECRWADFFRSRIVLKDGSSASIEAALEKALGVAKSKESKDLPGSLYEDRR
jgi:hypothetical protein